MVIWEKSIAGNRKYKGPEAGAVIKEVQEEQCGCSREAGPQRWEMRLDRYADPVEQC